MLVTVHYTDARLKNEQELTQQINHVNVNAKLEKYTLPLFESKDCAIRFPVCPRINYLCTFSQTRALFTLDLLKFNQYEGAAEFR